MNTIYESGPVKITETNNRILVKIPDGVIIIPVFPDGDYLLIKESRLGIKEPLLEFPMGGIDDNESPLEAANRELLEETGATATCTRVGFFYPAAGLIDQKVYVFHANIRQVSKQALEDYEDIEVIKTKQLDLIDGYSLAALQLFHK